MKKLTKISLGIVAASVVLLVGCSNDAKPAEESPKVSKAISEESLGLRKVDLYSEDLAVGSKTEYGKGDAGSGKKFNRAFQDAPPMIPHNTEGMLPITINDNQCIGCHMPEVAEGVGATPIPSSHFTNFRPHHTIQNGEFKKASDNMKNEVAIQKLDTLVGARFNCSQCHAPQSQGNLLVENKFEPEYVSPDGASRSSWSGEKLTYGLQTIEGEGAKVSDEDLKNAHSPAGSLGGGSH